MCLCRCDKFVTVFIRDINHVIFLQCPQCLVDKSYFIFVNHFQFNQVCCPSIILFFLLLRCQDNPCHLVANNITFGNFYTLCQIYLFHLLPLNLSNLTMCYKSLLFSLFSGITVGVACCQFPTQFHGIVQVQPSGKATIYYIQKILKFNPGGSIQ